MQDFIAQFGSFAPIVFLILASVLPIFLFPPGIFSAIGGYLFGFTHGFILSTPREEGNAVRPARQR